MVVAEEKAQERCEEVLMNRSNRHAEGSGWGSTAAPVECGECCGGTAGHHGGVRGVLPRGVLRWHRGECGECCRSGVQPCGSAGRHRGGG